MEKSADGRDADGFSVGKVRRRLPGGSTVPWLDGMWLNGKTMEEIEPYFGAEPICLNVHMQEEQAVKAVVLAGEEETTVPLVYEAQEDGWAAEAVLSPEEGCWRFCLLWEKEDGSRGNTL